MMRSWNRVAARKLSDLPVTHIEIAPHRGTTIALAPRWRVVRVAAAARTSVHSTVMSAFMAMTSIC
jgi:hypothetical protein